MEYLTIHSQNSGKDKISQLGFGTAGIGDYEITKNVILNALSVGFRRFDTASMYKNEKAIGAAIKESDIPRDEIFITTKLWNGGDFSYEATKLECQKSIDRLGIEYIDLYLHHWPAKDRLESWKAMEELVEEQFTRYIGISNYMENHLEQLLETANITPVLNQVEFNPFLYQEDLMNYNRNKDIIFEAYSPFAQGKKFENPTLKDIARKYSKSTAQIMLRWGIQLGISIIPKATSRDHINQNFDIFNFSLSDQDMSKISSLDENLRLEWDPTEVVVS